MFLLINYLPA
ncbi:hypothetical protein MKD33_09850, partial [Chromobacterium piscinae]